MARVFQEYELEYQKLKLVADMLTTFSPNGTVYIVEVTYLDFGQDWKWTTIISDSKHSWQILNPREWEKIVESDSIDELFEIAKEVAEKTYELDRRCQYGKQNSL